MIGYLRWEPQLLFIYTLTHTHQVITPNTRPRHSTLQVPTEYTSFPANAIFFLLADRTSFDVTIWIRTFTFT